MTGPILLAFTVLVLGSVLIWNISNGRQTARSVEAKESRPNQEAAAEVPKEGSQLAGSGNGEQVSAWNMTVIHDGEAVPVPQMQKDSSMPEKLKEQVAAWAGTWNRAPVDSQLQSYDKTTHSFQYTKEEAGRKLDEDRLTADLMKEIASGHYDGTVTANFIQVPPNRTQAQAKEQYQVIGSFTTETTTNKNRNENIRLAAEALDGKVLQPGEEFSFNLTTGNRTKEKGYQPAGAYRNGVLIEEPGGGVCQVSTTLYHAIIESGFMTTERNNHSYAPSYVAGGQDAMVSYDGYAGPDLKFVNKEDSTVAIRADFKDNVLKMSIVGLPILEDGVHVEIRSEKVGDIAPSAPSYEENPIIPYGTEKVIDNEKPGAVWRSYRVLKKGDQVLEEDPLYRSTYRAKPAVIQRNTMTPPETAEAEETAPLEAGQAVQSQETGTGIPSQEPESNSGPGSPTAPGSQPAPGSATVPGSQPASGSPTAPGSQPASGSATIPGSQPAPGGPTAPGSTSAPGGLESAVPVKPFPEN